MKKKTSLKKDKISSKNFVLILGVVYTLISILAVISYVSKMNTISTTPVTLGTVLGSIWWQILMIILFAMDYILYSKKPNLGSLIEIIMGLAMLTYIVVSIALMGIAIFALIIELIYPLILIVHGLISFKKITKQKNIKPTR